MLLQFECANHKSIKDRISFSMLAGSDRSADEYLGHFGKIKVLRSAAIYGANGSGKSNFLDAIAYMHNLVAMSIHLQPGEAPPQIPHKLSPAAATSDYDVQFVRNGIRYAYGFSVAHDSVASEYLYFFPKGRKVRVFERQGMTIEAGPKFKGEFAPSIKVLKSNRLFLSCAANYSNVAAAEESFRFFAQDLVVYNHARKDHWLNYSIQKLSQNADLKRTFLQILAALGTPARDVKIKLEPVNMADLQQVAPIPDFLKDLFGGQTGSKAEAKIVYDEFETDLLNEESAGIKRLFEILCPLLDVLLHGKVLLWDELEANLHEALVLQILRLFHKSYPEQFAQLIFTTHDTSLLNADFIRRDQIWFTELTENRATDLYSLVEIRNVRKNENIEKGYITGRYGAIPMLDTAVLRRLEQPAAEL